MELFQCPNCKKKAAMTAGPESLTCNHCGYWENVYGEEGFLKGEEMDKIDWQTVVDNHILASRRDKKEKPDNVFSPSMVDGCLRQSTMLKLGLKEFDVEVLRNFMVGTILHKYVQTEAAICHVPRPVQFEKRIEFEIDPQEELPIQEKTIAFHGYIDAWDGETVYDFKSHGYIKYAKENPIDMAYRYQLSIYAAALGAKHAEIVFIDKKTLEVYQKEIELVPIGRISKFCTDVLKAEVEYKKSGKLPEPCGCWKCNLEKKQAEDRSETDGTV